MKKYFLFSLLVMIMPSLCFGASARYTQLVREKQRKMEQLEKCMGTSKGLKIAGISTLGLTAVGVAGNIYEADAIKTYDSQIKSAEKKIKSTEDYIKEKDAELKKKSECEEGGTKEYKDGQCVDKTPAETPQVTSTNQNQGVTAQQQEQDVAGGGNNETVVSEEPEPTVGGEQNQQTAETGVVYVSNTTQLINKNKEEETVHVVVPEDMKVQPEVKTEFSRELIYVQENENPIGTYGMKEKPVEIQIH